MFLHPGGGWTLPWHLLNREQLCWATANPVPPLVLQGRRGMPNQGCTHNPDLRTGGAKEKCVIGVRALLCWPRRSSAASDPLWGDIWMLQRPTITGSENWYLAVYLSPEELPMSWTCRKSVVEQGIYPESQAGMTEPLFFLLNSWRQEKNEFQACHLVLRQPLAPFVVDLIQVHRWSTE